MSTALFLLSGVVAGPLFVLVFLIEGALREGYDPMRQPVSALALGPRGWVQRANFIVTGGLMLVCAYGLSSVFHGDGSSFWAPVLIALFAIGLIGAGIFVTDVAEIRSSISEPPKRELHGIFHDLFSLLVFVSLFAATLVFHHLFAAFGANGWAAYSAMSGILLAIGFILFARGFARPGELSSIAGLLQRLTIAIGWLWIAIVAAYLMGQPSLGSGA